MKDIRGNGFSALTGLRGFAALWVLSYHVWVFSGPRELTLNLSTNWSLDFHPMLSIGWAGVQLLFVLSAFLLTLTLTATDRPPNQLNGYFIRRFARVFPAYYVQLIMLIGVAITTTAISISDLTLSQSFNFLIMNFMPPPFGEGNPNEINGVWWTLPIELSFYLILPIFLRITGGRLMTIIVISLFITAVWRLGCVMYAPEENLSLWFSQLPGSMDSFGIGVLAALIYRRSTASANQLMRLATRWSSIVVMLSLGSMICLIYWMDHSYLLYRKLSVISFLWTPLFSLVCAILIFLSCIKARPMRPLAGNYLAVFAGEASYGIYLWHLPITESLLETPFFQNHEGYVFPLLWLGVFLGSLLAGVLSWKLVEQPARRWAAKYGP